MIDDDVWRFTMTRLLFDYDTDWVYLLMITDYDDEHWLWRLMMLMMLVVLMEEDAGNWRWCLAVGNADWCSWWGWRLLIIAMMRDDERWCCLLMFMSTMMMHGRLIMSMVEDDCFWLMMVDGWPFLVHDGDGLLTVMQMTFALDDYGLKWWLMSMVGCDQYDGAVVWCVWLSTVGDYAYYIWQLFIVMIDEWGVWLLSTTFIDHSVDGGCWWL